MPLRDWTIVFDLDGTLVDTAPDLVAATNHVLADAGLAPIQPETLLSYVGHGARAMIERALTVSGRVPEPSETDRQLELFLAYYADNIAVASRPFDGVVATLAALSQSGAELAVCTNKSEALSRLLLDSLGLTEIFSVIAGRDTFEACKPDPRHLLSTIDAAGGHPERAIMIGDSRVDIATARAAAVPVIGVTFGYSDADIASLNPDALIGSYHELPATIRRLVTATA